MKTNYLNIVKSCNLVFLVIIILFAVGCKDKKEASPPDWVVNKDKMIGFLIDLHVVEAKLIKLGVKKDSSRLLFKAYQDELFVKHNIDDSVYFKSYNYYLSEVDKLREIYEAVVDSLNVKQQLIKQNDNKSGNKNK